jgi:hypothetical protein
MPAMSAYTLLIDIPANGRVGKSTVSALDSDNKTTAVDKGDLSDARELAKLSERMATKLKLDPEAFKQKLEKGFNKAVDKLRKKKQADEERRQEEEDEGAQPRESFDERAKRIRAEIPKQLRREALNFLRDPDLMPRIIEDIQAQGVAGESRLCGTLYLTGVSRLLDNPVALLAKGATASGKSYIVEKTSCLYPPESVLRATAITAQALFYMEPGALEHKWIIGGERSRRQDDENADATKALREMISSHRLSKLVTIKGEDGRPESKLIEQSGPVAFTESTTREIIFDEDENRFLSCYTDEQPGQTRRIIDKLAANANGGAATADVEPIIQRHHAVQRILRRRQVVIPFAKRLGELMPAERVECRRVFPNLLSMIQACTLLHQYQRERDPDGRIVATGDDYEIVYKLVSGPMSRLLGSGLSQATRRFFRRLKRWAKDNTFATSEARRRERHSKASVCEWLRDLEQNGIVGVVEQARGNRPTRWRILEGAKIKDQEVLPSPERVLS